MIFLTLFARRAYTSSDNTRTYTRFH
jgi:hypothetical protein